MLTGAASHCRQSVAAQRLGRSIGDCRDAPYATAELGRKGHAGLQSASAVMHVVALRAPARFAWHCMGRRSNVWVCEHDTRRQTGPLDSTRVKRLRATAPTSTLAYKCALPFTVVALLRPCLPAAVACEAQLSVPRPKLTARAANSRTHKNIAACPTTTAPPAPLLPAYTIKVRPHRLQPAFRDAHPRLQPRSDNLQAQRTHNSSNHPATTNRNDG
jgi:hypothetical protein